MRANVPFMETLLLQAPNLLSAECNGQGEACKQRSCETHLQGLARQGCGEGLSIGDLGSCQGDIWDNVVLQQLRHSQGHVR